MKTRNTFYFNLIKAFTFLFMCFALIYTTYVNAQELPPVLKFSPKDYQADNQNWSITQGDNKHIYIANNKGLLEYDGEAWHLYPSPNQTILRSVFFHNGNIYTGSYREFGYWSKKDTGILEYTSLSNKIVDSIGTDEQFWTIDEIENSIVFQSLDHIYTYDLSTESLQKINIEGSITKMFKLDSELYFQVNNVGLFLIKNGKPALVSEHVIFKENLVVNLYNLNNQILVQTNTKGVFTLENSPKPWPTPTSPLSNYSVYASIQKHDDGIVLGTISQGVVFVDRNGVIQTEISQHETLSNNTVLSVYEDIDYNIWLGLDNGINCVNVDSSIKVYNDQSGVLGTVYVTKVYNGNLYFGTNQGLFYRPINSGDNFKFVKNSYGQVWSLEIIDNKLFCGHNNGSFIVEDDDFKQVSKLLGTWCFRSVPNKPDLILQGNYSGLSLLQKVNDTWVFKNKIENFDVSSKFVEFISPQNVLINHEYKGVYKVNFNDEFTKVTDTQQFNNLNKSLYSSLIEFNESIYYANQDGIWKFNKTNSSFQKDSLLSQMYSQSTYSSGKLVKTKGDIGLWTFNKNSIDFTLQRTLNNEYNLGSIPMTSDSRNTMVGYENITQISEQEYLMGFSQGFMIIDYHKFIEKDFSSPLNLTSVTYWENGKASEFLNLKKPPELLNKFNNLNFNYSVPHFEKYFSPEYQYRLVGYYEDWSSWTSIDEKTYSNLPFGSYEFQVRAKIGDRLLQEPKTFAFTIKRPFVLSNLMISLYVILSLFLFYIIHITYKNYYNKQKVKLRIKAEQDLELKELEKVQEIMQVKNEQLQQDIESKNRELAVSTMSLIKKNEFLNSIKDELQKSKPLKQEVKKVIKIIDKNLNSSDDWKMFEEAFNNADKDFLKKMKSKHPALTSNDLRLCAYLRLNLSSKEIAPLFNISTKSVEVKRYRLRKKMDLSRDSSLTDYILEI